LASANPRKITEALSCETLNA